MTPVTIRNTAPARSATTLISPMVPGIRPMNMSIRFTALPLLSWARGVAVVTPSYVNDVIRAVKQISRKQRAPSAGFMKFCPSPPNSILTTIIAKAAPMTAIHHVASGGRLRARRSPVTTADRSPIVAFLRMSFSKTSSKTTQEAMLTATSSAALNPKRSIPTAVAGSRLIMTKNMIFDVDALLLICGEADTFILSLISPSYFFFLFASTV